MFNLEDRSWTDLPNMQRPSVMHGAICFNNRFFAIGGELHEKGKCKACYATVSMLDLITFKWSELKPLQTAVSGPGVAVVNTVALVIGGADFVEEYTTQAYKYDKRTGERTMCKAMPEPCSPYNLTVTAGTTSVFVMHTSSCLFMHYNTLTDQWTMLRCPVQPALSSAMVLHTNRLLLLGGLERFYDEFQTCIQSYNIANNTWSIEKQTMPTALAYHAAFVVKMPVQESSDDE